MNWRYRITGMALLFLSVAAFGQTQQSQQATVTDCKTNPWGMSCETKTAPTPYTFNDFMAQLHRYSGSHPSDAPSIGDAIKEIFAEQEREKEKTDTVIFLYCRANPQKDVTNDGQRQSCTDVLEYTKAFCLVNTDDDRCTLAKSKAGVTEAFAKLSSEYRDEDPKQNKKSIQAYYDPLFRKLIKWGCMSFPDMTLTQRDGTPYPCPDAK